MINQLLHLKGQAIISNLEKIGALRLSVFREFPYLYDGTQKDEYDYLKKYALAKTSLVVLVMDKGAAIGASTCLKLTEADLDFRAAFEKAGYDTERICYLGESVLLPEYRGHGIGKLFFQHRERHAKDLGCTTAAFCAVDRAKDHPARPGDYRALDSFWQAQGYVKRPELKANFSWKEVGNTEETPKTLTFWTKNLEASLE